MNFIYLHPAEFVNDGGPLLILPRELLNHWDGANTSSDKKLIPKKDKDFPFAGTDYARACAAQNWVAPVEVGKGYGIVMGAEDHIYTARWLRLPDNKGCLVAGCVVGEENSDNLLIEALKESIPEWQRKDNQLSLTEGDLILMHAASPGKTIAEYNEPKKQGIIGIGEGIPFRLSPGNYVVEESFIVLPDGSEYALCRFTGG
jgi:hypothetical protein